MRDGSDGGAGRKTECIRARQSVDRHERTGALRRAGFYRQRVGSWRRKPRTDLGWYPDDQKIRSHSSAPPLAVRHRCAAQRVAADCRGSFRRIGD